MDMIRTINLSLQLWSSFLTIIIIISLVLMRRNKTKNDQLFFLLLILNMCAMLMDSAALFFRGRNGDLAWMGVRLSNYLEFIFSNLMAYISLKNLIIYIERRLEETIHKRYKIIGIVFLIFSLLSLTVNLFIPFYYTIDKNNIYSRLPLYPLMYLPMVFILIIGLKLLIKNRKQIKRKICISFLLFLIIPAGSIFITAFIYGITFGYIGTTFSLTILFLYMQFEQTQKIIHQEADKKIMLLRKLERTLNQGIRKSMVAELPDDNLNLILKYLGQMLDGDRSYIFENDKNNNIKNTYEWCNSGIKPQIKEVKKVYINRYNLFKEKRQIIIKDVKDVDLVVYKTLETQNIHSVIIFSLRDKNENIGFVGIDNAKEELIELTGDILEIVSTFIVSLLKKRNYVNRLKALSYTDAGTGCKNTMAFYKYFEKIKYKKNIGVIFCDINGLKEVNDTKGHSAGNKLITDVYESLKLVFDYNEIFRIGGDEFVILCYDVTKKIIDEKIKLIEKELRKKKIVIAIGTDFLPKAADTIDKTIKKAETLMYKNKAEWYLKTKKSRRKI